MDDDCPNCPKEKSIKLEKSYRNEPRKRKYRPVSERRYSPMGCEPCGEGLSVTRKPVRYCGPCRDRCCQTDSGLLHTIRNSIQRIFNGGKTCCTDRLYTYSMSQLKCIEQLLGKLEDEACCIENAIREAVECDCVVSCNDLRRSLDLLSDRVDGVKCDLASAQDFYNPYRDRCESELICCLMERICCLEEFVRELFLQLNCLECQSPCDQCCVARGSCRQTARNHRYPFENSYGPWFGSGCSRSRNRRTCGNGCTKPIFDITGKDGCCVKPKVCEQRNFGRFGNLCNPKGLCRTSSVIPVGVMLVKL